MSADSSENTQTAAAIDPCAISASIRPEASRSGMAPTSAEMSPTPSPTSQTMAPTRVRSLAPLLMRENVKAILGLSGVKSLRVLVEFVDGRTDNKTIGIAPGGSAALLLLDDNPDQVPAGAFCDIRPIAQES